MGISARVIVALVAVALVFGVSGAMIGRYAVPSCAPTPLGSTAGRFDDAGNTPSSAVDVPLSVDTDVFGATSVGRAAAAPAAATAARKKKAPKKKAAPKHRTTRRRRTATRRRTTTRKPRATGTPKSQGGCRDANVIVPALPPSGDRNFAFIKDVRAALKRRTNSPSASNILPPNPDPRGAGMFYKCVRWRCVRCHHLRVTQVGICLLGRGIRALGCDTRQVRLPAAPQPSQWAAVLGAQRIRRAHGRAVQRHPHTGILEDPGVAHQ